MQNYANWRKDSFFACSSERESRAKGLESNGDQGKDRVISRVRGGLMRWLLASGSYFHRGGDGTRSVIEHVETISTLPIFSGRAAEACVSARVKYCFTRRSWRHRKERGRKTRAQRGKERERGLTRSGTRRGTREASGKKPSAIAIRTNIRSRDERRTNKEKCEREREGGGTAREGVCVREREEERDEERVA